MNRAQTWTAAAADRDDDKCDVHHWKLSCGTREWPSVHSTEWWALVRRCWKMRTRKKKKS